MGTQFWRQPAKRLDREFRAMGARRVEKTSVGVAYEFEDGSRRMVPANINAPRAREILSEAQRRYGARPSDPLGDVTRRKGHPTVDLSKITATAHAQERLALMRDQDDLTYREILVALRAPSRVLWSDRHGSWLWVGDRVCVAASVTEDGTTIIRTLLWTSQELWEANPRPGA